MAHTINDVHGCSTCKAGCENYTTFEYRGKEYYQYDYRTEAGELFSCVAPTLEACRDKRNTWLNRDK